MRIDVSNNHVDTFLIEGVPTHYGILSNPQLRACSVGWWLMAGAGLF
jgi:hypothetical protein